MPSQTFKSINNQTYFVEKELGRGGEGTVYTVKDNDAIVLKIYNDQQSADKAAKLKFMAANKSERLQAYAAWPLDILIDGYGGVIGFTVKKIREAVPLHKLFSPIDRKRIFPDKGYNFLVHVSRNLASAFHAIHSSGLIVGDVNEGNILVDNSGLINFIDCDSFQVNRNGITYFCEVGVPRYTPPELLQLGTFEKIVRTTNTDAFSMSVLIFQLLFLGRHPFAGRTVSADDIDEETAIKNHLFFYSKSRKNNNIKPPLNSLPVEELPERVFSLFYRSFENVNNRPLPIEWIKEIELFLHQLIQCKHSKLHYYFKERSSCPWCFFKQKQGIVFFFDNTPNINPAFNDINSFVQGFQVQKISFREIDTSTVVSGLTPNKIDDRFFRYKEYLLALKAIIFLAAIGLAFINPWLLLFAISAFLVDEITLWKKAIKGELLKKQSELNNFKSKFDVLIKEYNYTKSEVAAYNTSADKLAYLITNFKSLPDEFQKKQKQIEDKLYDEQLQSFLSNYNIANYPIPSFASGKKSLLMRNGIRTAADITKLYHTRVQGIGPANQQILFSWQRQMASRFIYKPDIIKLTNEIEKASQEIKRKKTDIENSIKKEFTSLEYLKANIINKLQALEVNTIDYKRKIHQANLDLNNFKSQMKV